MILLADVRPLELLRHDLDPRSYSDRPCTLKAKRKERVRTVSTEPDTCYADLYRHATRSEESILNVAVLTSLSALLSTSYSVPEAWLSPITHLTALTVLVIHSARIKYSGWLLEFAKG